MTSTDMIGPDRYFTLRGYLMDRHVDVRFDYAHCQSRQFPDDAETFVFQFAWAVLTTSRHRTVAWPIMDRMTKPLKSGQSIFPFCDAEEAAQIEAVRIDRKKRHATARALLQRDAKGDGLVTFLQSLPGLTAITAHRLARNLGAPLAVPDTALQQIAAAAGADPQSLCTQLAAASGDLPPSVGLILSRAVEYGLIRIGSGDIQFAIPDNPDRADPAGKKAG